MNPVDLEMASFDPADPGKAPYFGFVDLEMAYLDPAVLDPAGLGMASTLGLVDLVTCLGPDLGLTVHHRPGLALGKVRSGPVGLEKAYFGPAGFGKVRF